MGCAWVVAYGGGSGDVDDVVGGRFNAALYYLDVGGGEEEED